MGARKPDPDRLCEWCQTPLSRKRFSTGRLEDRGRFLARKFCDADCQRAAQIDPATTNRQTMYSRSRKLIQAACERCGATERLHAHHRDEDITNNAPANLETVCVVCHNRHHFAGRSRIARTALPPSETPSSQPSRNGSVGASSTGKDR